MPYPRHDFDIQVNWEVSDKLSWVDKNSDLYKTTGITMFRVLKKYYHPIYDWQVEIKTDDPYHYTFYDEEGDSYALGIVAPKMSTDSHDVMYNSKKPKIVRIVGKAW